MVSTRRRPKAKATIVVNQTNDTDMVFMDDSTRNVGTPVELAPLSSPQQRLDSIVASNDIHHQVSCNSSNSSNSSNTSSSNNSSDTSTVETTTATTSTITTSPPLTLPLVTNTNGNNNNNNNNSINITSVSSNTTSIHPTAAKSVPKKKSSKPLKSSLKQNSVHRRHTPPPPGSSSSSSAFVTSASLSPTKRSVSAFGITSNAHTRSNAGTAELLKGVETHHVFGKVHGGGGGVTTKQPSKGFTGNLMIGKNATKQSQKDSKDGIITIRNGFSVRKIVMSTGTLYIDLNTHRAEFVRTK